ncbi:hypothetical protein DER45DRAFT_536497 [Fusarium avenaceum]|nr:hypothetical protein DER45DRAFT_536497 [Fusarium avenaceum]
MRAGGRDASSSRNEAWGRDAGLEKKCKLGGAEMQARAEVQDSRQNPILEMEQLGCVSGMPKQEWQIRIEIWAWLRNEGMCTTDNHLPSQVLRVMGKRSLMMHSSTVQVIHLWQGANDAIAFDYVKAGLMLLKEYSVFRYKDIDKFDEHVDLRLFIVHNSLSEHTLQELPSMGVFVKQKHPVTEPETMPQLVTPASSPEHSFDTELELDAPTVVKPLSDDDKEKQLPG